MAVPTCLDHSKPFQLLCHSQTLPQGPRQQQQQPKSLLTSQTQAQTDETEAGSGSGEGKQDGVDRSLSFFGCQTSAEETNIHKNVLRVKILNAEGLRNIFNSNIATEACAPLDCQRLS